MDPHGFLRSRRSIRRFSAETVPPDAIERILETATFAPSAHNRQPWRFAVLRDPATKAHLAESMAAAFRDDLERDGLPPDEIASRIERSQSRIRSAPVVIILCMDISEMDVYPDQVRQTAERTMAMQSTSMAGLQLLLAAHAEGLGGVWNCAPLFAPTRVCEALGLPETWEPQGMLFIGFPAEKPAPRQRKPMPEISLMR